MSHPKLNTIAAIEIMQGEVDGDFDSLEEILLNNYSNRLSDNPTSSRYEDTNCPSSSIVDNILNQIINDFYDVTGENVVVDNYWGHIHEKNMSTKLHDHPNCFASGVVYISVPKGSGSIVFKPNIDSSNKDRFLTSFPPKRGRYYVFPNYLDHYVTRNNSDEMRISLSFNLLKKN
tara:strand:+ start:741 stop:1265 length:525 start_codon:yes stop_codon:yes gene_type:complete